MTENKSTLWDKSMSLTKRHVGLQNQIEAVETDLRDMIEDASQCKMWSGATADSTCHDGEWYIQLNMLHHDRLHVNDFAALLPWLRDLGIPFPDLTTTQETTDE